MSKILRCSLLAVALALASPLAARADAPLSDAGPAPAALTAPAAISGQEAAIEALVTARVLAIEVQRSAQAHPPLEVQALPLQLTGDPAVDRLIVLFTVVAGIVGAFASVLAHFVDPDTGFGKVVSWLALNFGKRLKPPPAAPDLISKARGLAILPVMVAIALASSFLSFAAHADATPSTSASSASSSASPAPVKQALPLVAPSDPLPSQPVTASSFGGCTVDGKWCFGPSVAITAAAINLTKKSVEGAFAPGLGYGLQLNKGQWYSVGADFYADINPATQQVSLAVMLKLVNGYLRIGASKGFIGDTAWRIPIGIGVDI